jgi:hypothetical protein
MVMTEMCGISFQGAACADIAADYKGSENWFKFRLTSFDWQFD